MTESGRKRQRERRKFALISVCSLCTFSIVWCIATVVLQPMLDCAPPSPVQVLQGFLSKLAKKVLDDRTLFQRITTSLEVALTGYFLGAIMGIPLDICMAWSWEVDLFVTPLFNSIRPVPTIAWIPLMILWSDVGLGTKAAIIFVSAFVLYVVNIYVSIKQTKPVHLWMTQTFGASRGKILLTVAVSTTMPLIFTGLRTPLRTAWMTLCAAKMLAANKDFGYMTQLNRTLSRAGMIIVGMLIIGAIGAIFTVGFGKLKSLMVKGGKKL